VIKSNDSANKAQLRKERFKRLNTAESSSRLLKSWLTESELNVDLAHVFQSLEDNRKKSEQLSVCSDVIAQFTHKACQTNRTEELLQAIEKLLQDYQEFGEAVTAKLYLAKHDCLKRFDTFDPEAEECINRAITVSKNDTEKIQAYLALALYQENISEYNKMKNALLKCNLFCNINPSHEDILAHSLLLSGHYYFYKFQFSKSKEYLNKARIKLELLCQQQRDKKLLRLLSECLHYMSRIYFEEHDFIQSSAFLLNAQSLLEETYHENNLTLDFEATAFYHLRLGHVLEACQIQDSAKYHFDKCRKLFNNLGNGSSSLVHVKLALANLIESESHNIKQSFQKEEEQIKDAAQQSLDKGYSRGYLMALVQLLSLYKKNRKIHLLIKVVWDILVSKELHNLGGIFFLKSYTYHKLHVKFRPIHILSECPCSDPKCKIVTHK
jgi:hypothetical protein